MRMKRTITFVSLLFAALTTTMAQSYSYEFVDADGNIVPNDTTLVRTDAEEDAFGGVQIASGLKVKNVSAPANYSVRIHTTITKIDNGNVQVCFPLNCFNYTEPGNYKSGETKMAADEVKDIQSEWLPTAYGECIVTYQAMSLQPMGNLYIEKGGPSVTLHYNYADPTKVNATKKLTGAVEYYSLLGHKATKGQRGVIFVKQADGTVRKVLNR